MVRLKVTPERVSAMRKRILRVLEKNPRKLNWSHDLYFKFRKNNNVYIVYNALLSLRHSKLVKVSYLRRGKQKMYGIPALSLRK